MILIAILHGRGVACFGFEMLQRGLVVIPSGARNPSADVLDHREIPRSARNDNLGVFSQPADTYISRGGSQHGTESIGSVERLVERREGNDFHREQSSLERSIFVFHSI